MKKRLLSIFVAAVAALCFINGCKNNAGPEPEPEPEPSSSTYQVTISASPTEGGTVSPENGEYEEGSSLEITASPNEGWRFDHWEGDYEGNNSSASITVSKDMEIRGVFIQKEYNLSVTVKGEGTVDEQVVQKAKDYKSGTVVELTANPAEGYRFVEWKGAVTSSENPIQITMDGAKVVTAVFEKKSYALEVVVEGEGAVTEEVVKAKDYAYGTKVKLTAVPATGWEFARWEDALNGGENPAIVEVDKSKKVTAVFEKKEFLLEVRTEGEGTVTKSPNQVKYEYNSTVDLTANPAEGYRFVEWKGAVTGNENPVQLTMDGAKEVTAVFEISFYLAANGVTVRCPAADVGDSGIVNGITYTKRTADQITTANASATCTSGVTNMSSMFAGTSSFNGDISSWDVSKVTNMSLMFNAADSFNGDLSNWDVSNVTNMNGMFSGADLFNGDLSNWNVSKATDMGYMFWSAISFNGNISGWDVSNVANMSYMFNGADSFNGDISGWNVSNVANMRYMFRGADSFNSDISDWNVSKVTDMRYMFNGADSFNGNISGWDVSNVTDMYGLFMDADLFNSDLNNWDVSKVTNMERMFNGATSFNGDLSNWDVGKVTNMSFMFQGATLFNQDLSGWCVAKIFSEPNGFSTGSSLIEAHKPVWGTCPI